MKILSNVLAVIGLLLLVAAGVGGVIGKPQLFMGFKVFSIIVLANSVLILAVLAKLYEKK